MNTTPEATKAHAKRMHELNPSNRYFLIGNDGQFYKLNDYGKATRFAFADRRAACLRLKQLPVLVYDAVTDIEWLRTQYEQA